MRNELLFFFYSKVYAVSIQLIDFFSRIKPIIYEGYIQNMCFLKLILKS